MCGSGYPIKYAEHAVSQVAEYMKKMDAHIGFALILDGRRKEQGQGFHRWKNN